MDNELKQAKAELAALIREDRDCQAIIDQCAEATNRQRKLRGWWGGGIGDIERAKRKVRDLQAGPIIDSKEFGRRRRVIGMTDKMIITRLDGDGDNETTSFRKLDGMIKCSSADSLYATRIDAPEAMRLWAEWCAEKEVE